jgi:DNA-binding FrmR family transcriptional regulator
MRAMTPRVKRDALFRLKSVLGHVDGVIRMLDREEYCIDIIKQVAAIEVALKKVSAVLLQNHLDTCVTVAVNEKSPEIRSRVVRELLEIFQAENQVSRISDRSSSKKSKKLRRRIYGKRSSLQHAS